MITRPSRINGPDIDLIKKHMKKNKIEGLQKKNMESNKVMWSVWMCSHGMEKEEGILLHQCSSFNLTTSSQITCRIHTYLQKFIFNTTSYTLCVIHFIHIRSYISFNQTGSIVGPSQLPILPKHNGHLLT